MKNKILESFGERVRELRSEQGYSQEQFAEEIGIDRSYLGRIERGENNLTLLRIVQIKEALDVEYQEIFSLL